MIPHKQLSLADIFSDCQKKFEHDKPAFLSLLETHINIVTNGLGIIRHISFYNKDFMTSHPDIVVEKKSDFPDEDKSVHDSKLLIPTLKDFFSKHPLINPKTFLGDAAFDTAQLYKSLLTGDTFGDDKHFSKAYTPLNARSGLENQDCCRKRYQPHQRQSLSCRTPNPK